MAAQKRGQLLIYRLEASEPNALRVRLEQEGTKRILYLDTLKSLAKPADAAALQLLTKLHLRASAGKSSDTLSFQSIHLPLTHAMEAIRLLAQTGRLYFSAKKIALGAKAKVHWKGEKHSEKSAFFEPYIDSLPLREAEAVFPGWAIANGNFCEFDSKVSWKWIERFRNGPVVLEGLDKKRFLEEEPTVVWKEEARTPFQVFPQLILTDPTGCFADLWMDYPGAGTIAFDDLAPQVGGKRRLREEELQWEKDLIEAGYKKKQVGKSNYYCPGDAVASSLQLLLEIGWSCFNSQRKRIQLQKGVELSVGERDRSFTVSGKVLFQEGFSPLQNAQRKQGLFLELDSGGIGLLDRSKLPLLSGEWEGDDCLIAESRVGEVLSLLEEPGVEWGERARQTALESRSIPLLEPVAFQGTLLGYQKEGAGWLSELHRRGMGALLSDEMGLGKTVQTVAFFSQLRTNLPILVVAPTSLVFHWQREIERFWPDASSLVYHGPNRLKDWSGCRIILSSYAVLRQEAEFFASQEFEVVALDESQAIKTFGSQTAKAAFGLKARFRLAITGTPVENRAEELWSQFRFALPDLLGERSEFQSLAPQIIRNRIKPYVLRRKKRDVHLQLPDKIDGPVWIEMTEKQRALYDGTMQKFRSGLLQKVQSDGLSAHRMEVLEVILRLRQICSDPRLVGEDEKGAKAEWLIDVVEDLLAEGKKVVVFSQFTTALKWLKEDLAARSIQALYLDGSTPASERNAIVERFQQAGEPQVFLLSLKAGGVGLNLTAAETAILFDPWWNDAVEQQAVDRAHRIGQKNTLFVHRCLTPGSIEEKMLQLKAKKTDSANELLEDSPLNWTSGDWLHLLAD